MARHNGTLCKGTTAKSRPCKRYAGKSGYCLAHDPDRQARRRHRAISVKGGHAKNGTAAPAPAPADLPPLRPEEIPSTARDWKRLLAETAARILRGEMLPAAAKVLEGLAAKHIKLAQLVKDEEEGGDGEEMTDEQLELALMEQLATVRGRIAARKPGPTTTEAVG